MAMRWMIALLAMLAVTQPDLALAKRPKPQKTEVSKAVGKCVGLVIGGALVGAPLGGKKNRGSGALVGAGVGAGACALVMATAKRQDLVIAAQREAAAAGGSSLHLASFRDDKGSEVKLSSRAQDAVITAPLIPVRYEVDGAKRVSPELADAAPICRYVTTELSGDEGTGAIPNQLYCQTADNAWEPYALGKA